MLDVVEEALDEVAFAIEHEVALAGRLPVGSGRNDRGDGPLIEGVDQGPAADIALATRQKSLSDERKAAQSGWQALAAC
jgi:hypothetical protein